MLGLKLNYVSKSGPRSQLERWGRFNIWLTFDWAYIQNYPYIAARLVVESDRFLNTDQLRRGN